MSKKECQSAFELYAAMYIEKEIKEKAELLQKIFDNPNEYRQPTGREILDIIFGPEITLDKYKILK